MSEEAAAIACRQELSIRLHLPSFASESGNRAFLCRIRWHQPQQFRCAELHCDGLSSETRPNPCFRPVQESESESDLDYCYYCRRPNGFFDDGGYSRNIRSRKA